MSTPIKFTSAAAIRSHALNTEGGNGKRWFSKDTMKFWATRMQRGAPTRGADGRWYFIVSNDPGASIGRPDRRYAVCTYDASTNEVETVNAGALQYGTIREAREALKDLVTQ